MIDSSSEVAPVEYANDFGRRAAARHYLFDFEMEETTNGDYTSQFASIFNGVGGFFQTVWFGFEGDGIEALLGQNEIIVMSNDGWNGDGIIRYCNPYGNGDEASKLRNR